MFKDKLYNILDALDKMVSHDTAMERCINEKLLNTLNGYSYEVENTCKYLLTRDSYKILKNVAKQKEKK